MAQGFNQMQDATLQTSTTGTSNGRNELRDGENQAERLDEYLGRLRSEPAMTA